METEIPPGTRAVVVRAEPGEPPERFRVRLGAALRARREAMGYSQAGLARAIGVSPASVSQWESGRRTLTLDRLLQYLEAVEATPEVRWQAGGERRATRAAARAPEVSVTGDAPTGAPPCSPGLADTPVGHPARACQARESD